MQIVGMFVKNLCLSFARLSHINTIVREYISYQDDNGLQLCTRSGPKSGRASVRGSQSLVCALDVKAISYSTSLSFDSGAILSKAENSLRQKKYCSSSNEENENRMPRANRASQSRDRVPSPRFRLQECCGKAWNFSNGNPQFDLTESRSKLEQLYKFVTTRLCFCFCSAILVFVKRLFFKSAPKGLKTFLIQLIRTQRFGTLSYFRKIGGNDLVKYCFGHSVPIAKIFYTSEIFSFRN